MAGKKRKLFQPADGSRSHSELVHSKTELTDGEMLLVQPHYSNKELAELRSRALGREILWNTFDKNMTRIIRRKCRDENIADVDAELSKYRNERDLNLERKIGAGRVRPAIMVPSGDHDPDFEELAKSDAYKIGKTEGYSPDFLAKLHKAVQNYGSGDAAQAIADAFSMISRASAVNLINKARLEPKDANGNALANQTLPQLWKYSKQKTTSSSPITGHIASSAAQIFPPAAQISPSASQLPPPVAQLSPSSAQHSPSTPSSSIPPTDTLQTETTKKNNFRDALGALCRSIASGPANFDPALLSSVCADYQGHMDQDIIAEFNRWLDEDFLPSGVPDESTAKKVVQSVVMVMLDWLARDESDPEDFFTYLSQMDMEGWMGLFEERVARTNEAGGKKQK